jgi:hypothetical protein
LWYIKEANNSSLKDKKKIIEQLQICDEKDSIQKEAKIKKVRKVFYDVIFEILFHVAQRTEDVNLDMLLLKYA